MKLTRDEILLELMEFFLEEVSDNEEKVRDWLAQGDHDADIFVTDVQSLRGKMRRLLGD